MGCPDLYDPLDNRIHLLHESQYVIKKRSYAIKRFRYWIFRRWGWRCAYCERELHPGKIGVNLATLDHIVPRSRSGSSDQSNLVPACPSCNCSKGNRDVWEWYLATPFYLEIRADRIRRWQSDLSQRWVRW